MRVGVVGWSLQRCAVGGQHVVFADQKRRGKGRQSYATQTIVVFTLCACNACMPAISIANARSIQSGCLKSWLHLDKFHAGPDGLGGGEGGNGGEGGMPSVTLHTGACTFPQPFIRTPNA